MSDPPPADNADWVTAMNDYVTAGEDLSDDNTNEADDTAAEAMQEIEAGNATLASFNSANGEVLERDHRVMTRAGIPATRPNVTPPPPDEN